MTEGPTTPLSKPTILLVDDMDACRITMKWFLSNLDFTVVAAASAAEAAALFDPKIHDLLLTDNSMPGMTGAELAHFVKERSPSTPVLMYTGKPPVDQSDLDLFVQKPTHILAVKDAIDRLLKQPA